MEMPCHQCAQCFSCRTICDTGGDIRCSACKRTNRACYKRGENVDVPQNQRCHTCYTCNMKYDGKSPCSSCLGRRYQCRPHHATASRLAIVASNTNVLNVDLKGHHESIPGEAYHQSKVLPLPPLEKDLQWRIALRYVHQAQGSIMSTSGGNPIIFIALVRYLSTA